MATLGLVAANGQLTVPVATQVANHLGASGGRFDSNIIARYEFRTGSGNTAFDTSGIEPAINILLCACQ